MKSLKLTIFILFLLMPFTKLMADDTILVINSHESMLFSENSFIGDSLQKDSTLDLKKIRKEKLVAALVAFPFPLGFVGAHRVILGTKPWIPIVYVATFGGVFGIVPMIDFCVILFSKDLESYKNNPQVFMWVK